MTVEVLTQTNQTNPQCGYWLDCLYTGLLLREINLDRGTCIVGTAPGPNTVSVDLPITCIFQDFAKNTPIDLEEALSLGEEICRLVGLELTLDFLYAKKTNSNFFRSLYCRILHQTSMPPIISLGMRVGRIDVRWSVLLGWIRLMSACSSQLFAVRAVEHLAETSWSLTPKQASAVGQFASAAGLLAVRCSKKDAQMSIAGHTWIYMCGRDKAALSVLVLCFAQFFEYSWPELERARQLLAN